MPNDTDFTVTKAIASGVNFANTAGIEHYHTPLDTLSASSTGTLQHHGDHVLATARVFADAEPLHGGGEDAVWFDVMALAVVAWPESWALPLALVATALVVGIALRARAFDRGLGVFLPAAGAGAGVAFVAGHLLEASGALPAPFVAHPLPAQIALHAGAAAAVAGVGFAFARRSTPRALWAGTWLGWGLAGVAAAVLAPGTSYLFVVPTAAAALAGGFSIGVACSAPAVVAAALVLPLATGLYSAVGVSVPALVAVPTILLGTTTLPMLVGQRPAVRRAPALAATLAAGAGVVHSSFPVLGFDHNARTRRVPARRGHEPCVRRHVVGADPVGSPPAAMLGAIGWGGDRAVPPVVAPAGAVRRRGASTEPRPPSMCSRQTSARDGASFRYASARRAAATLLAVTPFERRASVKVDGHPAFPRPTLEGLAVALLGVPPEGVVVDFDAIGLEPTDHAARPISRTASRLHGGGRGARAPGEATPFRTATSRSSFDRRRSKSAQVSSPGTLGPRP